MAEFAPETPLPFDHQKYLSECKEALRQNKQWAIQANNYEAIPESQRQKVRESAVLNVNYTENEAEFKRDSSKAYHEANVPLSYLYQHFIEVVKPDYETQDDVIYFVGCAIYNYMHFHHQYHGVGISSKTIYDRRAIGRGARWVAPSLEYLYQWKPKIGDTTINIETIDNRQKHADYSRWIYYVIKKFSH